VVVALSRFRVANGREDAVREAFLDRPGLVDHVPGFLGLDVFTDTQDASLFYLITRWTDAESFERWRSGPDPNLAHRGIPKGLRLDASFTLVRTLDRISGPATSWNSDEVRDSAPVISEVLIGSTGVHWLKVRSDGVIVGSSGERGPARRYRLNFVNRDRMPFTLDCHVDVQPDGFVLIGEAVQQDELALQRELMTLNNQFAVLLRENGRKTKALNNARAALEKALKDLLDSHWLLRKMQEVLPVCMGCGKVKTGDSKWEEVVEYLKHNSLFLSHGYCPACLVKELDALER
jgi:heme-degrading monooxygenase HmoA